MDAAKTVVLIHGHGVDSSIWDGLSGELSADYQIVRPGFSTLATHNTIEAYAEYTYSILQSAQVEKATLIGHSMGGYIALAFAEHHPEMVSGLVLFNSTVFADDEARKAKRQEAVKQLQQQGSAAFIGETVPKMFAESNKTALSDEIKTRVDIGNSLPAEALTTGIQAIAARPDRSHVLREASFPVLVIAGKEDNIIPFDKSEQMASLLNDKGKFVTLEKAGHLGMIEQPENSVTLIREFLVKV